MTQQKKCHLPAHSPTRAIVFDTGPLAHFAQAGLLDVLEMLVGEQHALMPMQVVEELRAGMSREPALGSALDAEWIEHYELATYREIRELARFSERLGSGKRNLGEAAVLALASSISAQAMVDDRIAYRIAQNTGISCKRALAMLCEGINSRLLTRHHASSIVDGLIATEYWLPCERGAFIPWAIDNKLIPPIQK